LKRRNKVVRKISEKYSLPKSHNFKDTYCLYNKDLTEQIRYDGKPVTARTFQSIVSLKRKMESLYYFDLKIVQIKKDFHGKWKHKAIINPSYEEEFF